MKLELPYPPGVNTLYGVRAVIKREDLVKLLLEVKRGLDVYEAATRCQRFAAAFPFKTSEHTAYATHARLAMYENGLRADQLPRWPKPAELGLKVRLYRPRRAGDIDGPLKTLFDSLQGNLYENDDQVTQLDVVRLDDKQRPRVELEVTELATNETPKQEVLFAERAVVTPKKPIQPENSIEEPWTAKVRRLARPAVIRNRSEDPEAA